MGQAGSALEWGGRAGSGAPATLPCSSNSRMLPVKAHSDKHTRMHTYVEDVDVVAASAAAARAPFLPPFPAPLPAIPLKNSTSCSRATLAQRLLASFFLFLLLLCCLP